MTEKQILEKAIRKAIDGGWGESKQVLIEVLYESTPSQFREWYPSVIFNHDFAKALWGEKEWRTDYSGTMGSGYTLMPSFMAHLQQMVIAENPIKYLGDSL